MDDRKRASLKLQRARLGSFIPVQCGADARSTKAGHESTACIKQVHSEDARLKQRARVSPSHRAKVNSVGGLSGEVKLAQKVRLVERGLSLNRLLNFRVARR